MDKIIENANIKLIKKLQAELNSSLEKLLGFNPCYTISESSKGYVFSATTNNNKEKSIYNISFTFKVCYTEKELNHIIIEWLGISPKNTGMGTKIIKSFLKEIEKVDKIKNVYLHPQGFDAKRFWRRLGFGNNKLKHPMQFIIYEMVLSVN